MANIGYDIDELGTNPNNKVVETRTLSKQVIDGRLFVIPKAAPFFAKNHTIKIGNTTLVRDVDFAFILHSNELSERLADEIYGGIIFNNASVNDVASITLQTVGGDFNLPIGNTIESMARLIRNPHFTTWSDVVGTPTGLPTFTHLHDWSSVKDFDSLCDSLNLIYLALIAQIDTSGTGGSGTSGAFLLALKNHLESNQAHDKNAVGLGLVQNYAMAVDTDFTKAPYPANKYTSPRTVMYAINLFLDGKINEINSVMQTLQTSFEEVQAGFAENNEEWNNVSSNLSAVDQSYKRLVEEVKVLTDALTTVNTNYNAVNENQQNWLNKLAQINDTLAAQTTAYNQVVGNYTQLSNNFNTLQSAYSQYRDLLQNWQNDNAAIINRLNNIEKTSIYLTNKVLTAGSHRFHIKPGEKYRMVLIGAGGGVGTYSDQAPSLSSVLNGEHGGSTSFWCLQNMVNGEFTPTSTPIVVAGGGFGGCASYGNNAGIVSSFGIGGRGGDFKYVQNLINLLEASAGEGGIKGNGNYNAAVTSQQDTGYTYFDSKWGQGAITATALGQGGEGAIVRFEFTNTTTRELEFMIDVGAAGRSYDPTKSNATGGIAIINKVT